MTIVALIVTLPVPPSANSLFRNVPGKGRVRTERYKTWARAAGNELLAQVKGRRPLFKGDVCVRISLPRKGDLDNRAKAILDILKGVAYADDKQVVQLMMHYHTEYIAYKRLAYVRVAAYE